MQYPSKYCNIETKLMQHNESITSTSQNHNCDMPGSLCRIKLFLIVSAAGSTTLPPNLAPSVIGPLRGAGELAPSRESSSSGQLATEVATGLSSPSCSGTHEGNRHVMTSACTFLGAGESPPTALSTTSVA